MYMELPVGYIGCAIMVHHVETPLRIRPLINDPAFVSVPVVIDFFGGSITFAHPETLPYNIHGGSLSNACG